MYYFDLVFVVRAQKTPNPIESECECEKCGCESVGGKAPDPKGSTPMELNSHSHPHSTPTH